jgi:uncharacterized Rmd1/YagE family protein
MNAVERFAEVKMSKNSQETRIALLEQSNLYIKETLERIEKRFEFINKRFDIIDDYFKSLRSELGDVRRESWTQMRWILAFIIAFMGLFITALCKFMHIG